MLVSAACGSPATQSANEPEYLYLWTASEDRTLPDFLAVLDGTDSGGRYGPLLTTRRGQGHSARSRVQQIRPRRPVMVP